MAKEQAAQGEWAWAWRYVAVISLSLILAAALGDMTLFQQTHLGRKMNAAHIVQFLGFGAALVLSWLLAQRATSTVREQGGKALAVLHLILPVASLAVVALANRVLLLLLRPFLDSTMVAVVNWIFIIAIVACAAWLVMAVFDKSAALTDFLTGEKGQGK